MTRLEVFKWGIPTPLLLKDGLGVVCLNLTPNGMIFSELFPTTPNPSLRRRGVRIPHLKAFM